MRILIPFLLLIFSGCASAQVFTFECKCESVSSVDCDICNTSVLSRTFNGLLIKRNGTPYKWIDEPYTIRQLNGEIAQFIEQIPNPESVQIALYQTPFFTMAGLIDSTTCFCSSGGTVDTIVIDSSDMTCQSMFFYPNDTAAVTGGQLFGDYYLQHESYYGLPDGVLKMLVEPMAPDSANSPGCGLIKILAGTAISVSGIGTITNPYIISNTAPDQIVSITNGGGVAVSGTYPNFTLTATDQSITNELQTLSLSGQTLSISSTNNVTLPVVNITAGTGISVSSSAGNFTVTNTGDLSVTNEGDLSVGVGLSNTSEILSNTSGSSPVVLKQGTNITLTETGDTITINSSGGGGGAFIPLSGTVSGSPVTGLIELTGNDYSVLEYSVLKMIDDGGNEFNIISNDEGRTILEQKDVSGDYYSRLDIGQYSVGLSVVELGTPVGEIFLDANGVTLNGITRLSAPIIPWRITQTTRDALTPEQGMTIYNTTTNRENYYTNFVDGWKTIGDGIYGSNGNMIDELEATGGNAFMGGSIVGKLVNFSNSTLNYQGFPFFGFYVSDGTTDLSLGYYDDGGLLYENAASDGTNVSRQSLSALGSSFYANSAFFGFTEDGIRSSNTPFPPDDTYFPNLGQVKTVNTNEVYDNKTGTGSINLIPTGGGVLSDFLINPGSNQAAMTLVLNGSPVDGNVTKITFFYNVTSLSVTNGTILGTVPTTAVAGDRFEFKYYNAISQWIRIK